MKIETRIPHPKVRERKKGNVFIAEKPLKFTLGQMMNRLINLAIEFDTAIENDNLKVNDGEDYDILNDVTIAINYIIAIQQQDNLKQLINTLSENFNPEFKRQKELREALHKVVSLYNAGERQAALEKMVASVKEELPF